MEIRTSPPPSSAPAASAGTRTALQKHVDFFDRDHDGKTRVWETYRGLRKLKLGRIASAGAALFINGALGVKTGSPWYSWLTIHNDNIHQGKHDGDSDVYDDQGNAVQAKLDEMFRLHDTDGNDALDRPEIDAMLIANGGGKATLGSRAEFKLLLKLAGEDSPGGKVLTRQRMQQFYDGTLFYVLAGETPP